MGFSISERFDVVLSGINIGLNLGNSMWHSGSRGRGVSVKTAETRKKSTGSDGGATSIG